MGIFKKIFGSGKTKTHIAKNEKVSSSVPQTSVYMRSGYNLSEYDPAMSMEEQGFQAVHSTCSPVSTSSRLSYSPEALDFEDAHEKEIEKWNLKIDNTEPEHVGNPDKIVAGYEKAIDLCNQFQDFCYSFGYGGSSYYDDNEAYRIDQLEKALNEYLSTEYDEDKRIFEENKQAEKL